MEFIKKYPDIPLYTLVQNSNQIEEQLLRNKLDFGIMDYPINAENFFCRPLKKDSMAAVCACEFAIPHKIAIKDLSGVPLLVREEGSGSRSQVEKLFRQADSKPNIIFESIDMQSLIEVCLRGAGILFLPRSVTQPYQKEGRLKEIVIKDADIMREYFLTFHKSKFLTKSMKFFYDFLIDQQERKPQQ